MLIKSGSQDLSKQFKVHIQEGYRPVAAGSLSSLDRTVIYCRLLKFLKGGPLLTPVHWTEYPCKDHDWARGVCSTVM